MMYIYVWLGSNYIFLCVDMCIKIGYVYVLLLCFDSYVWVCGLEFWVYIVVFYVCVYYVMRCVYSMKVIVLVGGLMNGINIYNCVCVCGSMWVYVGYVWMGWISVIGVLGVCLLCCMQYGDYIYVCYVVVGWQYVGGQCIVYVCVLELIIGGGLCGCVLCLCVCVYCGVLMMVVWQQYGSNMVVWYMGSMYVVCMLVGVLECWSVGVLVEWIGLWVYWVYGQCL